MEREKKKKKREWRRGSGQERAEGENQAGGGTMETGHDPLVQMRNKTVDRITHCPVDKMTHRPVDKMTHHLGEELSRREGQTEGETACVSTVRNKEESGIQMGTEKMEEMNKGLITVTDRDNDDDDPASIPPAPSISPLSISTLSSPSPSFLAPLSSFSPVPSLTPPLPPSVELCAVLTDTRLTLDVYQGGTAVLQVLWVSVPGQLRGLQYLRLGSEDRGALEGALEVLPHLTQLRSLAIRGNCLASLPPSLGQLKTLHTLDVSYNLLETLPEEIGALEELVKLELSHNRLKRLPETMGGLLSLRDLVIHSNDLRVLPVCLCLDKLDKLKVDVRNNPLGRPPTPPPLPPTPGQVETRIPELHLGSNRHRFCVSSAGCHVFLPGGAELLFPSGCLATTTTLQWAERRPDRKWVWLEEHDFLLSRPLELLPHGISFLKPVEVCVPYHRSRKGEVVVRRFDGQQWSTLSTETRRGSIGHSSHPGGRPARLACVSVRQFSWFVAVSRPVRDSCSVTPEGALLVSRSDAGIKLTFPPDCTVQTRTITLQVLQVSVTEVQTLCGDPQARVSPLLCLSQDPSIQFLQPIKVQVPLPTGLTGHTVDLSCLHLLHGDPSAHTWTDITSQVSLYVTQLYAIFYITHFSWYWLWYTTQRCVSGVVRRVYQRLKQFQVQFLVLQRRTDPKQVLLQCLPADKVDNRVQSLSEQYDGPQPSDLCDLLEGEQFFAGFERGLDVSADRPDCAEGRLSFVFYSRLKNLKEVYVCPTQKQEGSIRGQVSFYRGEVPSDIPQEVARKRKGHDSQWLATLPLRLPGLNSEGGSNGMDWEQPQYPPLNLGDPESGYLTEANLLAISLQIGQDWRSIGINLGISYQELDRMQYKYRDNLGAVVLEMLFHWARGQQQEGVGLRPAGGPGQQGIGAVPRLIDAMVESGRRDLAEEIKDIVRLGTRKYNESLRRVGLEEEEKRPSTDTDPSPSH